MVDRVRSLLDRIAPTHREAAGRLGLDPTKLSKSLNGVRQFTLAEVTRIADLGHVDVRWLLDGQGPGPLDQGAREPTSTPRTRVAGSISRPLGISSRNAVSTRCESLTSHTHPGPVRPRFTTTSRASKRSWRPP